MNKNLRIIFIAFSLNLAASCAKDKKTQDYNKGDPCGGGSNCSGTIVSKPLDPIGSAALAAFCSKATPASVPLIETGLSPDFEGYFNKLCVGAQPTPLMKELAEKAFGEPDKPYSGQGQPFVKEIDGTFQNDGKALTWFIGSALRVPVSSQYLVETLGRISPEEQQKLSGAVVADGSVKITENPAPQLAAKPGTSYIGGKERSYFVEKKGSIVPIKLEYVLQSHSYKLEEQKHYVMLTHTVKEDVSKILKRQHQYVAVIKLGEANHVAIALVKVKVEHLGFPQIAQGTLKDTVINNLKTIYTVAAAKSSDPAAKTGY